MYYKVLWSVLVAAVVAGSTALWVREPASGRAACVCPAGRPCDCGPGCSCDKDRCRCVAP
jgi:hypothetical protein